ncbi:MAG TPA: hypothetical protein VL069_11895, partial [Opitutus sp.]|nr:hypothetical protein [Opitutus sp.]
MQIHPAVFRSFRWGFAAPAAILLLTAGLSAQTSPVETSGETDEVVKLSPFDVVADTKGYQSFNT